MAPISDPVMRDLAAAGFNISLSLVETGQLTACLDIAARHKVRLIVWIDELLKLGKAPLDEAARQHIREIISGIKDHPGLYGYILSDEPEFARFAHLGEVANFIRSIDPFHLCYINLETPIHQDGSGSGSVELAWGNFIEKFSPQILSATFYPVRIGWEEEFSRLGNGANKFGNVIVKPEMFEVLDHYRTFSLTRGLPFWGFTCSSHHGPYPKPTEGYMRFQLFSNLAYGARGLQYFSYAYASSLVQSDGTPTPELALASRINRDIRSLWTVLRDLQSIGVYHTGPVWSGTRVLPTSTKPMTLNAKGDAAIVSFFQDRDGMKYALLVNRNPVDWARFEVEAHLQSGENQHLCYFDPTDGIFFRRWPYRNGFRSVTLAPGDAILFRLGGDGPRRF